MDQIRLFQITSWRRWTAALPAEFPDSSRLLIRSGQRRAGGSGRSGRFGGQQKQAPQKSVHQSAKTRHFGHEVCHSKDQGRQRHRQVLQAHLPRLIPPIQRRLLVLLRVRSVNKQTFKQKNKTVFKRNLKLNVKKQTMRCLLMLNKFLLFIFLHLSVWI